MGALEALGGWMVSPGLFLAGAAAISVPILIHLFNRRRFRTIEWAAMDFLLEAERKNRRRILIENLILLALRCLAVFLIGLVLARPFLPSQWTGNLLGSNDFERIVILDDSLSMQATHDNESAFDQAKESLARMVRALATDRGNNSLTILTTTAPEERIRNGSVVNASSQDEILAELNTLVPSSKSGDMSATLQEVEQYLNSQPKNINRMVYVISDMRDRDWNAPAPGDGSGQPKRVLERIAKIASGCFVVDVGEGNDDNLIIQEIRSEGSLVAGVEQRFDVTVANPSSKAIEDVEVRLVVGDAAPLLREIETIPAKGTASATFTYTFVAPVKETEEGGQSSLPPVRIRAEARSTRPDAADRLALDSQSSFPARLMGGIPALLVDGDPSATYGRAETFFLRRGLSPRGEFRSGVAVKVATETELESLSFDRYQVIFLCNVFRLSDDRIAALEEWVRAGGSLVLAPGDQVEEDYFNQKLYRGGAGLAPFELRGILGDETEEKWVHFTIEDVNHPAFAVFEGAGNPFLKEVKVFRYWNTATPGEKANLSVPVRLSDIDHSIAVAEKPFGAGRVVAFAVTLDGDWSNWPDDPSYVFSMQELVRHLAGNNANAGLVRVSQPIRQWVDLTQHRIEASIARPDAKKISVQAAAVEQAPQPVSSKAEPPKVTPVKNQSLWRINYETTDIPGFYELALTGVEGGEEPVLFAANVDPTEGQLSRVNESEFRRDVGSKVRIVSGDGASEAGIRGAQQETWWYLLWLLLAVLGIEQVLGLIFGRSR
jgi:hypothetical protein